MSRCMSVLEKEPGDQKLSLWWRNSVILVLIFGFSILIWLSIRAYRDGPPIPKSVVNPAGETIFTGDDIMAGQQVFLKYGLMENGTIWGHGRTWGRISPPNTCTHSPWTPAKQRPGSCTSAAGAA